MGYTPEWYEKNRQRLRLKYQEKKHENFFTFSITRGNYIIYWDWCAYNPFYLQNKCTAHAPRRKNGLVNTVLKRVSRPTLTQNLKIGGAFDKYSPINSWLGLSVLSIQKMTAWKWLWVGFVDIPPVQPPSRMVAIQFTGYSEEACTVVVRYVFVGVFCEVFHVEARRCSTHLIYSIQIKWSF